MESPYAAGAPTSASTTTVVAPLRRLSREILDEEDVNFQPDAPYEDDFDEMQPPREEELMQQRQQRQQRQRLLLQQQAGKRDRSGAPIIMSRQSLPGDASASSQQQVANLLQKPGYSVITKPTNGNGNYNNNRLSLPLNNGASPGGGLNIT